MGVSIVIPNWNGQAYIGASLKSLRAQTVKAQLIVVDNGSTDGSQAYIKEHFPETILIELNKNYGFARGVNHGIKQALSDKADFIALFNNDAIADKKWLEYLIKRAETSKQIGAVTGKFLRFNPRSKFDSTGEQYSIWGLAFPRGRDQDDRGQYERAEPVFGASGGASLYRRELFKDIGLFDERFFAYYEDLDLSFRARLRGWEIYYEPRARAYHKIGTTSSKHGQFTRYHQLKNFYFLYFKNMPVILFWKYLPRFVFSATTMVVYNIRNRLFSSVFKSHLKVLVSLPVIFVSRIKIQHQSMVSSDEIDGLLYREVPPTQKTLLRLVKKFHGKR